MPRVKHLGFICEDPEKMKDYYCRWFQFEELSRAPEGSVYLTDGYLNVGLLKLGSDVAGKDEPAGLHRVGFEIETLEEIKRRLTAFDPAIKIESRPKSDPYSEHRIRDGGAIAVDLSEKGYGIDGEKRLPGIRHIATGDHDVERRLRFYSEVFGMREVETKRGAVEAGKRSRGCVADGFVNICLVRREYDPRSASHFGIIMRHPERLVTKLQAAYPEKPELWRPDRAGVEVHIRDLERNALSLSDKKGWEVDIGKWDRIEYEGQA